MECLLRPFKADVMTITNGLGFRVPDLRCERRTLEDS